MSQTGISATKEPHGLLRSVGLQLDGLTLTLLRKGRCLVWNVTVADTTAACYLVATATTAGSAAESAAVHKETKYVVLSNFYYFFPLVIKSYDLLQNHIIFFI